MHIELNISIARKDDSTAGTAISKPVFPFGRQVSAPVLVCSTDTEEDNTNASFRKALKKKTESKLDESSFLMVFHEIGTT